MSVLLQESEGRQLKLEPMYGKLRVAAEGLGTKHSARQSLVQASCDEPQRADQEG